jgi:hypothetical protein
VVFNVRVKGPQSIAGRSWNRAMDVSPIVPLAFIVLKLTGVITWSWWWVLSPLWIGAAPLVLLAGGLLALWCLGRLSFSLVNPFHWRRRRQARLFLRSEPPPCHPRARTSRDQAV